MSIAVRRYMRRQLTSGTDSGYLPFLMPAASALRAERKVFAHYMPIFPRSFEDAEPSEDYYATNYLMPTIEGQGQSWATDHRVYGGWVRTRPTVRVSLGVEYEALDARWEVRQASEMGVDGFFVDIVSNSMTSDQTRRMQTIITEAGNVGGPGFYVVPMIDIDALNNSGATESSTSDLIALFDNKSSTYLLDDGRLLVGIFHPENRPTAWYQTIAADYKARYGKTIAWVGAFVDMGFFDTYRSVLYGAGQWGDMGDPATEQAPPGYMATIKTAGLKYLGACWSSSYRPKAGWYDEAVNTGSLRAWWNRIVVDQPDFVQLTTWNDFTEGSGFMETVTQGRVNQDLSAYYLVKYKTGTFPPIVRDCIYLSHPTRTYGATVLSPYQTQVMTKRASSTPESTSNIEAVVFLTAPATVNIVYNGATSTFSGVQGINIFSVPVTGAAVAGAISASVVRSGVTTTSVSSAAPIRSSAWNDDHQYMMYSSLRGTTAQCDPTPNNDGSAARYPSVGIPPDVPRNITVAYTAGQDHAVMRWDPPVSSGSSAVTNYIVARDDAGGVETSPWSGVYDATTRQLDFLYLKPGTYTFSVAAQNSQGVGRFASAAVVVR